MTHGKQTIAVGFDYRRWVEKRELSADFLGSFTFNNDTILQNGAGCPNATGDCGTGNSIADFLLGYYNNVSTFQPGPLVQLMLLAISISTTSIISRHTSRMTGRSPTASL